jgi:hypothetical protein
MRKKKIGKEATANVAVPVSILAQLREISEDSHRPLCYLAGQAITYWIQAVQNGQIAS